MPQFDIDERQRQLQGIRECLNTSNGELLVKELEIIWEPDSLMGDNPEETAYNVGLRDAFKFIMQLKTGAFINE